MRLDLETTMIVDTTLASLQSEDLESDLKKLIRRVAESKENANQDAARLAMGLTRIANTRIKEKKIAEAKSYLDQADQVLQNYLKSDSRPNNFLQVFSNFAVAESSVGQHARALAMVRQYPDPAMVPQLMVRVAASMK